MIETDLRKALSSVSNGTILSKSHEIIILYNSLCALNFIHSANILHREIKPSNMLIDDSCQIKICDFGLSRTAVSNTEIN